MGESAALMFQATCSDAGKSLLVAGLCRAFLRRGLRVRPFKPQNMSNNAAIAEGGEIGRAQALQARACGISATVDMNPILLKPEGRGRSQLVVRGRVRTSVAAAAYYRLKGQLLPVVLESFHRLCREADLVLVEGAGSAAEINLRHADLANMGFAVAAEVPVVLIGDIDRGGVIASIVGTAALLDERERALLRGYVINKFRGDPSLFTPALPEIASRTRLSCLGIVPWFEDARRLPAEDSLGLDLRATSNPRAAVRIAVPRLPHLANFDDLDPLSQEPDVELRLIPLADPLPPETDLVLLPGSKNTIADLEVLRASGFDADIRSHVRRGGLVLGICGGYQMLGRRISDPHGIEGGAPGVPGLSLLDVETVLEPEKRLREVAGREIRSGMPVRGYEIHLGRTRGADCRRPFLQLGERYDGAVRADGRVMGCYLHGLFCSDPFRRDFLGRIRSGACSDLAYEREVESTLDALAAHLERHLDLDRLLACTVSPPRAAEG